MTTDATYTYTTGFRVLTRTDFDTMTVLTLDSGPGHITAIITPDGISDTVVMPDGSHLNTEAQHDGYTTAMLAAMWLFLAEVL
jgi:hypothetical protein